MDTSLVKLKLETRVYQQLVINYHQDMDKKVLLV